MPVLFVDRAVQKQCDKLFTTEKLIEYGILIGSSNDSQNNNNNNNNNAKDEQQNTFCIVGTIPVSIDDPTPSSVPTNQLLSNVEKIAASLCGGIQVVGIYVFVRATGRDSSLLSNLESSLNSFSSNNNNNKIANNKIALQLTSNHASARILNNTGGAGRQADIKFTSLQEQYVFLQSSLSLNIQLYGNSNDSLANLYDENTLFHKFKNNMIIQVDNKYMPSDIATNIPIGHLPYRDIHNVKFYPESDVIVGSNKNNNKQKNNTLVHFKGTFHFKAYVHEKNSTKTGLELLLNDLKFSIKKRFEMCSVPEKDSNNGIIEYVPIRYEVTSSSTVLSKCFLNYFILSKDNDVMDAVDDVKTELAQIGILAKEVITNESISIRNILGINILRKCKDGKQREIFIKKDGILNKKNGNVGGDVNVNLNVENEMEFEIEDVTPKLEKKEVTAKEEEEEEEEDRDRDVVNSSNNATNVATTGTVNGKSNEITKNGNMPLIFVGVGLLVLLLAIALMFMKPTK